MACSPSLLYPLIDLILTNVTCESNDHDLESALISFRVLVLQHRDRNKRMDSKQGHRLIQDMEQDRQEEMKSQCSIKATQFQR